MDQLDWTIARIEKENEFTKTFYLKNSESETVAYLAGQFLTFLFKSDLYELRRSYSFSSAPGIDAMPSITIKRIANGAISRQFHDHLAVGDKLASLQPAGRFTIESKCADSRQFCFIAAGSGIVPIFSLIKQLLQKEPLSEVLLLNQNHDEESIIFSRQLNDWHDQFPDRLQIINILSDPLDKTQKSHRLTNDLLEILVSKWIRPQKECFFYLCGPESFMRMAQFTLRLMGFEDRQIRREYFTVQFVPPPPLSLNPLPRMVQISMGGKEFRFETRYPNTILQSALDHKIQLPYSCRGARCSTCMAKCISGNVKMSMNEVLTDQDIEQGWILTCVGYAASDVSLSFGS
jgi:ring-1,2-phenylacetyl-CoA epoxidase subunit PaaE